MRLVPDVFSNLDATNVDLVSQVTCEANSGASREDSIAVYVVTRRRDGAQRIALSPDAAAVPGSVTYLTREEALQMAAALQTAAAKLED